MEWYLRPRGAIKSNLIDVDLVVWQSHFGIIRCTCLKFLRYICVMLYDKLTHLSHIHVSCWNAASTGLFWKAKCKYQLRVIEKSYMLKYIYYYCKLQLLSYTSYSTTTSATSPISCIYYCMYNYHDYYNCGYILQLSTQELSRAITTATTKKILHILLQLL